MNDAIQPILQVRDLTVRFAQGEMRVHEDYEVR